MADLELVFGIITSTITIIAAIWLYMKLAYRAKEKFLYITNCSILPISLWNSVVKTYGLEPQRKDDQIYRPLLILPKRYELYLKVRNGKSAILEFLAPDGDKYIATATVYWIPEEDKKWNKLRHPAMSLVLRRYFGVERPMFQDPQGKPPEGWTKVEHGIDDLVPIHERSPDDPKKMMWAVSKDYSFGFVVPSAKRKMSPDYVDGSYIEYCGLSLKVRKKSVFVIETDK